jgi:hypothetical protein
VTLVRLLLVAALCCVASAEVIAQQGAATLTRKLADSASASLSKIDSLYRARDTASLVRALRDWKGSDPVRVRLYRGITEQWSGRATGAIQILRPLLDSSSAALSRTERRDAIRSLAESYSRTRRYADAADLYDRELSSLDAAVDSANARADSAAQK